MKPDKQINIDAVQLGVDTLVCAIFIYATHVDEKMRLLNQFSNQMGDKEKQVMNEHFQNLLTAGSLYAPMLKKLLANWYNLPSECQKKLAYSISVFREFKKFTLKHFPEYLKDEQPTLH